MGIVRPLSTTNHLTIHTLCNGPYSENCYVVEHTPTRECVIIDPGSDVDFLDGNLAALNLRVSRMLLTHGHFDHLGAVDSLMKKHGIACEVHVHEKKLVRQAGTYAFRFARQRLLPPMNLSYYEQCNDLKWGGGTIRVLHTPGHTSGSVCYVFDDAAVFTGDTLFHSFIGPSDYPESNFTELLTSVALIVNSLPNECLIFPGHSKPWKVGEAKQWWQHVADAPPRFHLFGENKT